MSNFSSKVVPALKGFRIARNPKWLDSVKISGKIVAWLPESAYRTMVMPIKSFLASSGLIVVGILGFVFLNTAIIIAGLCGYLSHEEVEEIDVPVDSQE